MSALRVLPSKTGETDFVLPGPEQQEDNGQPESLRQLHDQILIQAKRILKAETEISRQVDESPWTDTHRKIELTRPILCTLPPCDQESEALIDEFLLRYRRSQSVEKLDPCRRQFRFYENGEFEEKNITSLPAYTIQSASGKRGHYVLLNILIISKQCPPITEH